MLRYSQPSTFRTQVLPLVLRKRSRLLTDVLLVCLLDSIAYTKKNDVYTHDSQFSDISGVAKLFCIHIHMPACRILHFNWLKRHGLFAHVFKPRFSPPVLYYCSDLIFQFAFPLHENMDVYLTVVTPDNSMY